jgi:hypothetical protein
MNTNIRDPQEERPDVEEESIPFKPLKYSRLSKRSLFYLYRCLLAQWFTRPTKIECPTPTFAQQAALLHLGFLSAGRNGPTRLTEAGLAELALAGIDTRNAKVAEATWAKVSVTL